MTGKQDIAKGFNLDRFVGGAVQPDTESEEMPDPAKAHPREVRTKQVIKEKAAKELLSERVQLKVTASEMKALREKAGMVPLSAFLRKHLQDSGLI